MDRLAVVLAQLLLLLVRPAAERLLEVEVGVLGAHHEADLAGRIGRDGGVCVLNVGEDLLAGLLEVDDERHVEPLVLSCKRSIKLAYGSTVLDRLLHNHQALGRRGLTTLSGDDTTFTEGAVEKLEVSLLEESLRRSLRITGVGDDDIKLVLLVLKVLEAIANEDLDLGVVKALRHFGKVLLGETDDSLGRC